MSRIIEPKARVTIYDPINRKVYTDFSSFHSVTSSVGVGGAGSEAIITYWDPQSMKFFSGKNKTEFQSKSFEEVDWFKNLLKSQTYVSNKFDPSHRTAYNELIKTAKEESFDKIHYLEYDIEEMWLCWIDYWGYDPRTKEMGWFAGFTGIITGFTETISRGESILFKIKVSDFRRVLNITAMFADRIKLREEAKISELEKIPPKFKEFYQKMSDLGEAGFWQRLKGKSNYDILSELFSWINIYMIRPTDSTGRLDRNYFGKLTEQQQKDNNAYYDRSFWNVPQTFSEAEYKGFDHRRGKEDLKIGDLNAIDYFMSNEKSWASLGIDSLLTSDKIVAIQRALISFTSLFQINWETPWTVIDKLAKATMSLAYVDAKGNFINTFPSYDVLPELSWDHPEKDHGPNYIFGPEEEGFKVVELSRNEKPRVTMVGVDAGFKSPISDDQDFTSASLRWGSYWDNDYNLKKYGYRPFYASKLFTDDGGTVLHSSLNKFTRAALRKLNLLCDTGTMMLDNRPDLQPGRTLVLLARGRVYYIESVTQTYQRGMKLSTSLGLSWGRPIGEKVENPWKELIDVLDPQDVVIDDYSGEVITRMTSGLINPKYTVSKYVQIWDTVGPEGETTLGYFNSVGMGSKIFLDLSNNTRRDFGGQVNKLLLDRLISAINSSPSVDNITIGRADDEVVYDTNQRGHSNHVAVDIFKINGLPLSSYSRGGDFKDQVDEFISSLVNQGFVSTSGETGNEGIYIYVFNDPLGLFEYRCEDHIHLGAPTNNL